MSVELLEEGPDDGETVAISWLSGLHPAGHVANTRRSGGPLPFILVNGLGGTENVEESYFNELVSIHVLTHKTAGEIDSRDETDRMHRRMLLLARYLEDVDLADGRKATIAFVKVAMHPRREPYGDDQILRRVGRYEIGLDYAETQ